MELLLLDAHTAYATTLILLAGMFVAVAGMHAFAVRYSELRAEHAALAVTAASVATYLILQAFAYHALEAASHAHIRRWEQWAMAPILVAYPTYFAFIARWRWQWVALVAGAVAVVTIVAAACSVSGLWLARIDRVVGMPMPWGETLHFAHGPTSPWKVFSLGTWIAVPVFSSICAIRVLRDRTEVGGWPLLFANVVFILGPPLDGMVDAGGISGIFVSELLTPLLTGAMWWRVAALHRRRIQSWRRHFTASGDAMLVHDVAWDHVVDANPAAEVLFRQPQSALCARTLEGVLGMPPGSLTSRAPALGIALIEGACRRGESEFPAEITLRSSRHQGRLCVVASVRDITQRRQSELALVENERHLRDVIERCPIPVAEFTTDGDAVTLNASFRRLFGSARLEDSTFAAWAERSCVGADASTLLQEQWHAAIDAAEDGVIPAFRVRLRDLDARTRHLSITGVRIADHVVLVMTDLTEVLETQQSLAEQEALHRAVIEQSEEGVVVAAAMAGSAPQVELWNPRMTSLTGISAEAATQEGFAHLPPALATGLQTLTRESEVVCRSAAGREAVCALSSVPLPAATGGWRRVGFLRDLTMERQAEQERAAFEAQVQQVQQFESLGVLAGGIAHDFNNLLMTILGRAGIVRVIAAGQPAVAADLLEIEAAAQRAAGLCRQLLAYAGKGTAVIEVLDLAEIAHAMEPMLLLTVPKRVVFDRHYADGAMVAGDAAQIRQVLLNLVTNAAEAVGERQGRVGVSIQRHDGPEGDVVRIEVEDDGAGMDASTKARMFEPFFSTKFTGRGLGLAVVQGIVHAHRGTISVESRPGVGTRVQVALPAQPRYAIGTPSPAAGVGTRGMALIVDDEPALRAITAEMLEHLGFAVQTSGSAVQALGHLASLPVPPTVVVLDLHLPDSGTVEIVDRVRRLHAQTRIVIATGSAATEVRALLRDQSFDAMLAKPFGMAELSRAVAVDEQL